MIYAENENYVLIYPRPAEESLPSSDALWKPTREVLLLKPTADNTPYPIIFHQRAANWHSFAATEATELAEATKKGCRRGSCGYRATICSAAAVQ